MDRRSFVSLSVRMGVSAAGAGTVLAGCGKNSGDTGKQAPVKIRLGDNVADSNPEVSAEKHLGQRLAALTENRYSLTVYPDGVLGDAIQMNEALRAGTLEMTKCLSSNLTPYDKRLGVLSLPYAFLKQQDLFDALGGKLGNEITKIIDGFDMVVLGFFDSGARSVYNSKRPIRVPADLKGLRIRVPQDVVAIDTFNTLGAAAVPLVTNEVPSAMARGIVDGAENNIIFYITNKHVDYAKYYSWTRHQYGTDVLLASKKWLAGLSQKDREIVLQAGHDAAVLEHAEWKKKTEEYTATAAAYRVHLNDDVDVEAFRQAVKPIFVKHRDSFGNLSTLLPAM